jgi:pyruvate,orthophosphate dikinase
MRDDGLVHHFGDPLPLDEAHARRWLGAKGASLAIMTRMGLPVPAGVTLTTDLWRLRRASGGRLPPDLPARLNQALERLGAETGLRFGDARAPMLLAVRSGAPVSMPGMLDTVLDVGVTPEIAHALDARFGVSGFGLDVRRRFLESFGTVVLGVPRVAFDALLAGRDPRTLDVQALERLVLDYERLLHFEASLPLPADPFEQLLSAIDAVLASWDSPRAQQYRAAHGIGDEGTAITLQWMVFGNLPEGSGAGVVFSRNPSTGEPSLLGEWLPRSQGEDIVSGRRTPSPILRAQVRRGQDDDSLERVMPREFEHLRRLTARLEARFGDMQDIEFAIQQGELFVLQCRAAKRTARAAARVAVDMVGEGAITRSEALARVEPASLRQLLTPRLPDPQVLAGEGTKPFARGLAASPGAAVGRVALDGDAARAYSASDCILVRAETSAEDVATMRGVAGVLTAAGGLTSHAAVVARAMGKPCVAGATSLHVDYVRRVVVGHSELGAVELREGDLITIDGTRGLVYAEAVTVEPSPASEHVVELLRWADSQRTVRVLAAATSERLARDGLSFGADGLYASGVAVEALRAIAGDRPLWWRASRDEVAAALEHLVPGRDVVVCPDADQALLAAAAGRGLDVAVETSVEGITTTSGPWVVEVREMGALRELESLEVMGGPSLVLRGELAAAEAALVAISRWPHAAIVVPPLDVPLARLRASQASRG